MDQLFSDWTRWRVGGDFSSNVFPGGTILMALVCNSRRIDGWDWVLSVIIPAYGLMKVLFNTSCR